LVQQSLGSEAAIVQTGEVSATGGQKYTLIAVGLFDTVQLTGQGIVSLIPGYALKFTFTTFSDPFLRVHESGRVMNILSECAAP
jgi:hypothetical protein